MADYTDKYNSSVPEEKQDLYELWLKAFPEHQRNTYDYDLAGAFMAGVESEGGHLPDTFKKPNHPTFSDGSIYHGVDGNVGGQWLQLRDGDWLFLPSATNWEYNGNWLEDYFKEAEPNGYLPQDLKD